MERELAWLLTSYFPDSLRQLSDVLKNAITNSIPVDKPSTLAITSSTNSVKGYVTINGSTVCKADLTIKFPQHNRGHPLKVALQSAGLRLDQLSEAKNCVLLALDELEELNDGIEEKVAVARSLDTISRLLQSSLQALITISPGSLFPARECDVKAFVPDLPEDVVIDVYISGGTLCVAVYGLVFKDSASLGSKLLGRNKASRIVKYKNRAVEVMEEVIIETPYPKLSTLVDAIKHCFEICRDLRDKISLF